jgi:hypothetical protein
MYNLRLVVDNTLPKFTDEELEEALFNLYDERTDGRNDSISEQDRRAMARWFGQCEIEPISTGRTFK